MKLRCKGMYFQSNKQIICHFFAVYAKISFYYAFYIAKEVHLLRLCYANNSSESLLLFHFAFSAYNGKCHRAFGERLCRKDLSVSAVGRWSWAERIVWKEHFAVPKQLPHRVCAPLE